MPTGLKSTLDSHAVVANPCCDFATGTAFTPYVGTGVVYDLSGPWRLGAGYRYVDLGKVVWGDSSTRLTSTDFTSHDLFLGLRYQF